VVLRKVDRTVNDAVVVHLHEATLADFLIVGDEAFTVSAANLQNMTAPDLYAIRVLEDFLYVFCSPAGSSHKPNPLCIFMALVQTFLSIKAYARSDEAIIAGGVNLDGCGEGI
jgi:hypothetical protein